MQENNFYKIDHHYNQKNTSMITTNGRPSVKSYREQIETMLTRWHQLQKTKQQCQPINFDEIMEADLTRQLHEIEEQEQYNLLKQTLELQLNQNDKQPCMSNVDVDDDTKKQLKQIEILKQHESDLVLQQFKEYKQFETIQNNQQVNSSYSYIYIEIYVDLFLEKKSYELSYKRRTCLYSSTETK
jgi:molybdopterin-biosynthesis enzyme MoeA-like protein